ncbi:MAG TPA: ABC transporter permease [Pirellula sp.]|nr:ABC transporter permease [Pirellula sp.]
MSSETRSSLFEQTTKFVSVHPVLSTVIKRLALGLLTLFMVSIVIFGSVSMLPGSYARAILGQTATKQTIAAFEKELGLDRPAIVRYIDWVSLAAVGDFGNSFSGNASNKRKVTEVIGPRLYNTLFLALMTASIAVPLSILLGVVAAFYRNRWIDRLLNTLTLITISLPEFLVAYILTYIVVVKDTFGATALAQALPPEISDYVGHALSKVPNFPILAEILPGATLLDRLWNCVLPALTLTLVIVAHMMRMTRAAIINLLSSPYIEMAKLKGAHPWWVVIGHALPNAWAPIAYVVAYNMGYLITGVVVVEVVFVYPGIGQLIVDSVRTRDIPVVQACALVFASTYILLNLVADIVTISTNPKLLHLK